MSCISSVFCRDNPALFLMVAIAGEEKCDEVVSCKVYQIGSTTVVLDFGKSLKIGGFINVLSNHI